MKKLLFAVLVVGLFSTSCKKDENTEPDPVVGLNPAKVQWGWTFEYTRTNCSTCGSTGGPLIHKLHNLGNVVAIAGHCTGGADPMETNLVYGFNDRPSGGSIPSFWVGDRKVGLSGNEAVDTMKALKTRVPIAGLDMSYSISGDVMTVKTKTKFFSAANGEFYLSVFVLEDGIDGGESSGAYNQAGASAYVHDFVLRDVSAGNVYGELITTNPAVNSVVDKEYTFTIKTGWVKTNCYPVAMIWKLDNSASPKHVYINAFQKKN